MAEAPPLSASDLILRAPDGRVILDGACLDLPPGGRAWIEGEAGSGKRALLKVLAGLIRPEAGDVRLGGVRLWPGEGVGHLEGKFRVGFLFAQGGLISNLSLRENLALPLRFMGRDPAETDRQIEALLGRLGLGSASDRRPHTLGARARRLAQFARIELLRPEAVFLSEPFEDLEGADAELASGLIRAWAADPGRLILAASEHAPQELLPGAQRLRLEAGRLHTAEAP